MDIDEIKKERAQRFVIFQQSIYNICDKLELPFEIFAHYMSSMLIAMAVKNEIDKEVFLAIMDKMYEEMKKTPETNYKEYKKFYGIG